MEYLNIKKICLYSSRGGRLGWPGVILFLYYLFDRLFDWADRAQLGFMLCVSGAIIPITVSGVSILLNRKLIPDCDAFDGDSVRKEANDEDVAYASGPLRGNDPQLASYLSTLENLLKGAIPLITKHISYSRAETEKKVVALI